MDTISQRSLNPSRDLSLDVLRIMACFAVVWLHVSALEVADQTHLKSVNWWTANMADAASRWCVPVFVMISGALIIPKASTEPLGKFYIRRLRRVLIPLIFWTIFYLAFKRLSTGDFSLYAEFKSILVGKPYYHLWYLYMLVSLSLITPFISRIVVNAPRGWIVVAIMVTSTMAYVSILIATIRKAGINTFLDYGPLYIGYFLLGYFLYHYSFPALKKNLAIAIFLFCSLAMTVQTALFFNAWSANSSRVAFLYQSPFVLGQAVCVFILIRSINWEIILKYKGIQSAIRWISALSLGIYLIHPVVLAVMDRSLLDKHLINPAIGIPLVSLLVFGFSTILARGIEYIPLLSKTIH